MEVEAELEAGPELTGVGMATEVKAGSKLTGVNGWATKVEVECAAGSEVTGASALVMEAEVQLTIKGAAALVACASSGDRGPVKCCETSWSLE